MTKLFENVYLIPCAVGDRPLNLPLLIGKEKCLLFDTGCSNHVEESILPYLKDIKIPLERITYAINSHCDVDHMGGNRGLKQRHPKVTLICGTADQELVEDSNILCQKRYFCYEELHGIAYDQHTKHWVLQLGGGAQQVDMTFSGGEVIRLEKDWIVEVLHVPGHSRGHLALFDHRNRAIYAGDAIHGAGYPSFRGELVLCPTYEDPDAYLKTIRHLESKNARVFVGAHWPIKRNDQVADFYCESLTWLENAEAGVNQILNDHPNGIGLAEICNLLSSKLGPWTQSMTVNLVYALYGHIQRLVSQNLVQAEQREQTIYYVKKRN